MGMIDLRRKMIASQPHKNTAQGAMASFTTDMKAPLKMGFDLVPIQAGTGDPSPENVRPITGHDGFTRNLTGINVWDEQYEVGNYNSTTGEKQPANNQLRAKNPIPVVPNTTYYFKGMSNGRVLFYKANGTYISSALYNNTTFTTPADCWFVTFHLGTAYGTTYKDDVGINYPATNTDYHAYVGHSYETEFPTPPGTVYGGHVTDNGDGTYDLTVNRAKWVFNGDNTIVWDYSVDANGHIRVYTTGKKDYIKFSSNVIANYIRDTGKNQAYPAEWCCSINIYGTILIGLPASFTSETDWKNYLESNNLEVVYELKNIVQYTGLTLTALQSIIGQNHVWVDKADSVSVEYWGH